MDWTHLFFSFDGRISRKPYWIASCIVIVASVLILVLFNQPDERRLGSVLDLALLYPDYAVVFKRAHDRDMQMWIPTLSLILSVLMTIVGILGLDGPFDSPTPLYLAIALPNLAVAFYLIADLGFRRGTRGPNRYGADPLEGRT